MLKSRNTLLSLIISSPILLAGSALAQIVPDISPALQSVTDRQAERAQQQAAEHAMQQVEAVQNRVAERSSEQQAQVVQSQTVERVASQVERAQEQATERAQNQASERAQAQLEQIQGQLDRAQNKAAEQAQSQIERAQDRLAVPNTNPGIGGVLAQAAPGARIVNEVGAQISVSDSSGNTVFMEITLPQGERVVAFEWVMLVSAEERQQLEAQAPQLLAFLDNTQDFALTAGEMLTFSVPADLDANDEILQLVPENLRSQIDRNHIYSPRSQKAKPSAATPLSLPMAAVCEAPVVLGIIDSDIDLKHPAFAHLQQPASTIVSKRFVEGNLEPSYEHGTAVAALLVGSHEAEHKQVLSPLLPNAQLYAASVFHKNDQVQEGASVMRILAAMDWLAGHQDIQVINMSLAGPANKLLEQTITVLAARGIVVVAAVGNDGPHGPTRYPAAYQSVIGVAAAEPDGSIYLWSNQGPYVDFTAVGVDVVTAAANQDFIAQSGTSLAAPVISAFVVCSITQNPILEQAFAALDQEAIDLGESGSDPVYGRGLLHP